MTTSIGELLLYELHRQGVDVVFGIPGVHTVELYRALDNCGIRHITPRHEQGAGFMADGYARVSGKPGVALVISGPGFTNTLTPMAQARADSVPMLVISGVSGSTTLGKGLGHLHELPDQLATSSSISAMSIQVDTENDVLPAVGNVMRYFQAQRGAPLHIQVPIDVMPMPVDDAAARATRKTPAPSTAFSAAQFTSQAGETVDEAILDAIRLAASPVILAGGGSRNAETNLKQLAELIDAPVVQTVNARGLMHAHPLLVPASPSLASVRELLAAADLVIALGTELGPTDYDMYEDNNLPAMENMIRVDICSQQLQRHPCRFAVQGRVEQVIPAWLEKTQIEQQTHDGSTRAGQVRVNALSEIGKDMHTYIDLLEILKTRIPGAIMVGDSTQVIYAANLYYDHDRAGGWFNSATGYGSLGYAIPAAVGAAVASPDSTVICLTGDGGAQFTLPELMCAMEERVSVLFVVWNNHGYQEIASSMRQAGVSGTGCVPRAPGFSSIAHSCSMPYFHCTMDVKALDKAMDDLLPELNRRSGPVMLEIGMPAFA